ncbi:MAG: hypothetical protein Q8R55_04220 [Candidatus Taylorbacteria bacterium]|nr:hypothetical protein [Candidatus Taylorbacteria bacterium]
MEGLVGVDPLLENRAESACNELAETGLRGVITPHNSATDEICAIAVFERRQRIKTAEIRTWGHPECAPDQIEKFLAEGFLPVEIGEMSYKAVGASSATEALTMALGYDQTSLSAGEIKLLELLARRNRDGYMNQFPMSLPRILKDLYDLPGYDELDLVERFKNMVHAFLEDEDREESFELDNAGHEITKLQDLVTATTKCQFDPFTPGRYLRDLWRRGEPADQIREKVSFWITAWNRWQEEYAKAKAEWPKMEKISFSVNGLDGAAVETANRFIAKVGAPTVDIFVNKRPDGHAAVMTRRRNASVLNRELQRLEPAKWHYHESAGNLINGGPHFPEIEPTSLSLQGLVGLVQQFPPK